MDIGGILNRYNPPKSQSELSRIENEICPIVFWQHDCNYENISEVETCNKNFVEWINEVMIEWTLGEYNFDGTEK